MRFLGYNYRMPDLDCAAGLSQLRKLPEILGPPGFPEGNLPVAEDACARLLSLPRLSSMTGEVEIVSLDVEKALGHYQRAKGDAA